MAEIDGLPSDLDLSPSGSRSQTGEAEVEDDIYLMIDEDNEDGSQVMSEVASRDLDPDGSIQKDDEAPFFPARAALEKVQRTPTLEGDPLQDLPAAEEGGAIVAIAKDAPPEIDAFMNQYGIVTSKRNKDWVLGLPAWLQWVSAAWDAAVELANDEDEALAGDYSQGGQKIRLRILSMSSIDGKVPEGSLQIAWGMFRAACKHINKMVFFSNFFGITIVINTIYMGFEVDNNWHGPVTDTIDQIFVTLFFFEIVIRITATDTFTTGNGFLYFDSAIVLVSVIDMWMLPLLIQTRDGSDLRLLQVFRICRLIRLARLLRLVKVLEPLRLMERSMRRGVNHFLSIMVFLGAYLYAASILIMVQLNHDKTEAAYADQPTNYCGSVLWLMVYLFEAMLSGYDWADRLVDPLLGNSGTRGAGVCLVGLLFCTKVAMANLITSSMVENYFTTMSLEATEVEQAELYRAIDVPGLEQLLQEADDSLDGRISWTEFVKFGRNHPNGPQLLRLLGIAEKTKSEEEAMDQLLDMRKVFQALDLAGEETIPIEVFTLGYVKLKGAKKDLHGLMMDVLLKKVMVEVRDQDSLIYPMERHITEIDLLMRDRLRDLKYIQLDLEEIVHPIEQRLSSLEATFARFAESLKVPDENTQVPPDARASISSMTLHAEMEELKKVAKAFIRSKGMEADCLNLTHAEPASAKQLPASTLSSTLWKHN